MLIFTLAFPSSPFRNPMESSMLTNLASATQQQQQQQQQQQHHNGRSDEPLPEVEVEHMDYAYIEHCENVQELENIITVLR